MRTPGVERTELISRLKKEFGNCEPIFTKEIMASWNEYSAPRVFQLLREFCADGTMNRYCPGIYCFPKTTFWGGQLTLTASKVALKKYIRNGEQVFGYYSGLTLLNMVGLSNQVPFTREIVTSKETTKVRNVNIGKARFRIRRAKTEITRENAPLFQILEIFSKTDRPLKKWQADNLLALAAGVGIDPVLLEECAKFFPKRALQNLKNSEIGYVLAQ